MAGLLDGLNMLFGGQQSGQPLGLLGQPQNPLREFSLGLLKANQPSPYKKGWGQLLGEATINADETAKKNQDDQLKRLLMGAEIKKALRPDIDQMGQSAFLKASQGQPLTAEEKAALTYIDSKQQTAGFNPVTGRMEVKPSLLDRAGLGNGTTPTGLPAQTPIVGGTQPNGNLSPKTQQELELQNAKDKQEAAKKLPGFTAQAEGMIKNVQDLLTHPGFETSVGAKGASRGFGLTDMLGGAAPGTDAAGFDALFGQVKGQQFMQAFENLKGGGQITEKEGEKATAAISRMNKSQNEAEFKAAAQEFIDAVQGSVDRARSAAGVSVSETRPAAGNFLQTPSGLKYRVVK